jgi:hypothetical protein
MHNSYKSIVSLKNNEKNETTIEKDNVILYSKIAELMLH